MFFPIHKLSCQRAGAEGVVLVDLVFVPFVPLVSGLAMFMHGEIRPHISQEPPVYGWLFFHYKGVLVPLQP
jgi:hypothetical protein